MSSVDVFASRLRAQIRSVEAARAEGLRANESAMRERLAWSDRFAQVASGLHQTIVRPMLQELTSHFENATTAHYQTSIGISSTCRFAATDRFPASVSLIIGITQGIQGGAILTYDLEIIPLLFSYEKTDAAPIDLGQPDEAAIQDRLTEWLLRFIAVYLRLETDPQYQDWHQHTDPVCGMRISGAATAQTMVIGRSRYYFCSQVCRDRFENQPELYAGAAGASHSEILGMTEDIIDAAPS